MRHLCSCEYFEYLDRKILLSRINMLILRRMLHTGPATLAAKSNLAKLRKRTGFSFVNCKKALQQFDQDVDQAEVWLQEQAQKEGWTRATKLKDRATSEGLIGLVYDSQKRTAALVEVNCETDFVARNDKFQHFVSQVAAATLQHYRKDHENSAETVKFSISGKDLSSLEAGGKSFEDFTALTIGQVKENMALRRALCMFVPEDHYLGYYVHSPLATIKQADHSFCQMGKYGSLISFQHKGSKAAKQKFNSAEFGRVLCQHVVGMNPLSVGEYTRPPPPEAVQTETQAEITESAPQPAQDLSEEDEDHPPPPPEEEIPTELLKQEFLLNPIVCVGEHLLEHKVTVADFARFEIGESVEGET